MSTKRYKPEQIVNLLRQIEVATAHGKTTPQPAGMLRSRPRRTTGGGRSLAGCSSIKRSG